MFERLEVASPARPWTTAVAFVLNLTALSVAILLPMIKPDQLPSLNFHVTTPIALPFFHEEVTQTTGTSHPITATNSSDHVIHVPTTTPVGVDMRPDRFPSDPGPIGTNLIPTGTPVIGLPITSSSNPPPVPATAKPPQAKEFHVSHLDEGMLIRRVQPIYPPVARNLHVQGTVVLAALISPQGQIEGLQVLSGHPLLAQAALDAVKQWRYRPYILNGQPIAVRTEVTVNFSLQQ